MSLTNEIEKEVIKFFKISGRDWCGQTMTNTEMKEHMGFKLSVADCVEAITKHIVEILPKEEVCTMYEGMKLEPRHYRMQGYNQCLQDLKERIDVK